MRGLCRSNEFKIIPHSTSIILNQERVLKKNLWWAANLNTKFERHILKETKLGFLFPPSNLICYDLFYSFGVGWNYPNNHSVVHFFKVLYEGKTILIKVTSKYVSPTREMSKPHCSKNPCSYHVFDSMFLLIMSSTNIIF